MKKTIHVVLILLLLLALLPSTAGAVVEMNEENNTYIFDNYFHTVDAPAPYYLTKTLTAADFGANALKSLDDLSVAKDGSIFLADGEGGTVYKLSPEGKPTALKMFSEGGTQLSFKNPVGVFASDAGILYVADSGTRYIYLFDLDLTYIRKINPPDKAVFFSEQEYVPLKVCADKGGRLYVISANQTQGILQFSEAGQFIGFLGATRVQPTASDLFWRLIANREQRKNLLRLIPTEYNNLDVDEDSFIYATVNALKESELYAEARNSSGRVVPIRRLNPKGQDQLLRQGRYSPMGDVNFLLTYEAGKLSDGEDYRGASKIVDTAVSINGIYSLLDNRRGRIYTYNKSGDLLFMFGGFGNKKNDLIAPTAIDYRGGDLIVSDKESATVKVFTPTAYAEKVFAATRCHEMGQYEEETAIWLQVKREYLGSELAYVGLGKADMVRKDYTAAMANFKLANHREYYSQAFKGYRRQVGYKNIGLIFGGSILLIAVAVLVSRLLKARARARARMREDGPVTLSQRIGYGKYLVFHPFKGFWDLKMGHIGTTRSASVILGAVVLFTLFDSIFSAYLFSPWDQNENILLQGFVGILMLVGLFVLSSWCLTSLFDGKGTMKDIYIYTCYSLVPFLVITPLKTILSYVLTYDEMALYSFIGSFATLLVVFLIFIGTLTVHNYSAGKTMVMLFFTVVGMIILVFIGILCLTLIQQIILYIGNVIKELQLR